MAKCKWVLVVFLAVIFSCDQPRFDTAQELQAYINDTKNGYSLEKTVNGYDFSLMYRPTDMLVYQEVNDNDFTKAAIDSLRAKYGKYMYFNLSISKNGQELLSVVPKDREAFGAMVNQLAFGMQSKMHLFTAKKDTLEMADYIYPRMYGMSRATTIMVVYPRDVEKIDDSDMLNFTVEDLGLFTGEVKFKIETAKLQNEPKINYST